MKQNIRGIKKVNKVLEDIAEVASLIDRKGWAEKNAGNISINLSEDISEDFERLKTVNLDKEYPELANNYFYITATGSRMRDIAKDPLDNGLVIRLSEKGNAFHIIYQPEGGKPTSELPSHLGIHQMCKQRGTAHKLVLHSHATELIALTQSKEFKSTEAVNNVLWNMHPESIVFIPQGLGFVPYILPGTEEIAQATIKMFHNHDIVLWEKHGVFAIGECILDTFDNIDIACKSVKIWFMCKSAGITPEGLSEIQLAELRELVEKFKT
jgi:rhamnulose-1-phosphate aldolase